MTLRTLNYGNYCMFLMMGNAGFCPSAVILMAAHPQILDSSEAPFSPRDPKISTGLQAEPGSRVKGKCSDAGV